MRTLITTALLFLFALPAVGDEPASFFDLDTRTLMGEEASLDAYRGKVCLVVNVASKCGLTPQYEKLQALY